MNDRFYKRSATVLCSLRDSRFSSGITRVLSDTTVGVACCAHRYITRGSKVEWGGESERRGKADEGDGGKPPPLNAHREDTHIGKTRT